MTWIERSEIRAWVGSEVCRGVSWRCWAGVGCGEVGVLWVVVLGVVGRAWGVCGAIRVSIARSALLSGYLGKSGHLPR